MRDSTCLWPIEYVITCQYQANGIGPIQKTNLSLEWLWYSRCEHCTTNSQATWSNIKRQKQLWSRQRQMTDVMTALGGFAQCNDGESQVLWVTSHEFLHYLSSVLSHHKVNNSLTINHNRYSSDSSPAGYCSQRADGKLSNHLPR